MLVDEGTGVNFFRGAALTRGTVAKALTAAASAPSIGATHLKEVTARQTRPAQRTAPWSRQY